MDYKENLIKILGLKPEDSDTTIQNSASVFQQDIVNWKAGKEQELEESGEKLANAEQSKKDVQKQLDDQVVANKALAAELVDNDMIVYKDVIENADEMKAKLISNRSETLATLKAVKKPTISNAAPKDRPAPVHNKNNAADPKNPLNNAGVQFDEATVQKISNRSRELMRSLSVPHATAFAMAQKEFSKTA